jgi:SAM-dependent methyltransferase
MVEVLRSAARFGSDAMARWRGQLVPPRRLLVQTSSPSRWEFVSAGRVSLECCRLGGLRPDDRFLDIGCGVGRVAIPLTGYLGGDGTYVGVDLWPEGVAWCTSAITPRYPHFTFHLLDLHHNRFNRRARPPVTEVRLPVDDGSADFVMLVAINHLTLDELRAFVREAGRALRPGGTYVGTWFLVDDGTRAVLPPTYADVACDEGAMRSALASGHLDLRALYPGSWRGGEGTVSVQDVVIAGKADT